MLAAVRWPSPPGETARPHWNGHEFEIGDRRTPVLEGDVSVSGWNEDLAALMALEDAPDRPLGKSSRRHVLRALAHHGGAEPGKVVVEIGCSNGYLLDEIRSTMPGATLIGCDYELAPLQRLATRLRGVPLIQLDIVKSRFPDECCDTIIMLNVLEHIEDDIEALRQVHRMLKPGGLLLIEVPASPTLYDVFDEMVGHFRRYTMKELVSKLDRAGFEVRDRSHLGFLVYPAFWLLKTWNKLTATNAESHRQKVISTLRAGKPGKLQHLIFAIEDLLRPAVPMPFGVRCLVTVVKA